MAASEVFMPPATSGTKRPSPLLHIRVFLTRAGLDEKIARGKAARDRDPSRALRLRAAQLARFARRQRYASALRDVLNAAGEPVRGLSAAPPLNRRGLRVARTEVLDLAEALETPGEVNPRGVAMVACLLRNGDSPIYRAFDSDELRTAATAAREALH
jgi:hypothetical protein